jgi:hypothetical protein
MTPRQAYALAHPANNPEIVLNEEFYRVVPHPTRGGLIQSAVTIDR